eukprot:superscaffoldBa00011179_g25092
MHKEKVSRREIGVFTAVRRVPRSHKILPPAPAGTQPRPPYSRRPINYQQLDSVGHGIKLTIRRLVEENFLPPPPPPSGDDGFPPPTSELPAPPPPPPSIQEVDVTLSSRRSRRRRSPPSTRSLSMRVRSGPASRCRYTRSLFLPAVQS